MREARHGAAHVFVDDVDEPVVAVEDRHHLSAVLRLRAGQAMTVADGAGRWRRCRYGPGGTLDPEGPPELEERPAPLLTVAVAPVKGDRPEWAVQKLTEIGVDRIAFVVAERSVVRWDEARVARTLGRLRRVAREAAMQSRRAWLPQLSGPTMLGAWLEQRHPDPSAAGIALAHPGGQPPSLEFPTIAVGPEGGWSPAELDGAVKIDLGPTVLRTETAAVVAGSLLSALRAGLVGPPATGRA